MKRNTRFRLFACVATFLVIATGALMAQAPSDPNMVYVHVTAVDRDGRLATGLHKAQFKIFEDNVPQEVAFFSDAEIPITAIILLDADGSIKDQVKAMALASFATGNSPTDEFLIVESAGSPLNDAVHGALNKLLQRGNDRKRVLVLLTMRADPGAYAFSKVKELLRDQDVQLFVIGVSPRSDLPLDQTRTVLRELAEISGGEAFFPSSLYLVQDTYRHIRAELRRQYSIGYHSTNRATDGNWRKIKVNAEPADKKTARKFTTRTKKGYYAPTIAQSDPEKN